MYALVYMDDILNIGSSSTHVHKLIKKLHTIFALKKLGTPESFLGIEIKGVSPGGIMLTQTKYICDLLSRAKMWNTNGNPTSMLTNCKLRKHSTRIL